ncbi:MAG: hypothetical protein Q8P18_22170 [Pseudomonadota bacterium]|nr:hypothetical protein [Pseudomonadota bacterium]
MSPSTIPLLQCEVHEGELHVVQLGDRAFASVPTFGWCGAPMEAGSVLFRVEVEVVDVHRLQ